MVTEMPTLGTALSCQLWVTQRVDSQFTSSLNDMPRIYVIEHRRRNQDIGHGVGDDPVLTEHISWINREIINMAALHS